MTWDQGNEMARHRQFTPGHRHAGLLLRSHSSLAAGINENTNGLLRQYFPKGTDLNIYTPDHLRAVEHEINNRPRRTLEDRSPAELFTALITSPNHQLLRR